MMKYLRCKCGIFTFMSDTQWNCHNCGRLLDIEPVQKYMDVLKETGLSFSPVVRINHHHSEKFDMNRWNNPKKRYSYRIGFAS